MHHIWKTVRLLRYQYLLAGCIVFAVVTGFSLRQNNLTAIKLRDEVLKTDEQNGDTEVALKKLRQYVYGHMNTNLASNNSVYPPIQLKYRYERLVAAEKARVEQPKNDIYNDAQQFCEKTSPQSFIGAGRLPCIQSYIDSHPTPPAQQAKTVPDGLYKYNFESPRWSPDLAGWSLVLSGLFGIVFVIRYCVERWMRHEFKSHM